MKVKQQPDDFRARAHQTQEKVKRYQRTQDAHAGPDDARRFDEGSTAATDVPGVHHTYRRINWAIFESGRPLVPSGVPMGWTPSCQATIAPA